MNDPLELPLRDIHLPDGVAWWPLAYGWWVLFTFLIVFALIALFLYRRNKLARLSAITKAKEEFARITSEYRENSDPLALSRELSILLRRLSISLFPRTQVASLTGKEWLAFLDSQVKGTPFTQGQGRMLIDAPYRQNLESDEVNDFVHQCQEWIEAVSRTRGKRI